MSKVKMDDCKRCNRLVQVIYEPNVNFRKPYKIYCSLCRGYIKTIDPQRQAEYERQSYKEAHEHEKARVKAEKAATSKVIITCPYCHSTDCKKLTSANRAFSFGLFGMGSSKIGKQWHCNKCKSDF